VPLPLSSGSLIVCLLLPIVDLILELHRLLLLTQIDHINQIR
jgi:hypothetical protein